MTVSILTDLLHNAESEKLHELYKILKRTSRLIIVFRGVKWTVRMLRWLLVVDIEIEEISHLKKCFLIALPRQEFYLEQMRIALVQLSDKILTFIQVSDLSLLVLFEKKQSNVLLTFIRKFHLMDSLNISVLIRFSCCRMKSYLKLTKFWLK